MVRRLLLGLMIGLVVGGLMAAAVFIPEPAGPPDAYPAEPALHGRDTRPAPEPRRCFTAKATNIDAAA